MPTSASQRSDGTFWALGVVKISVAFGGLATHAPCFVFGCLLIGEAVSQTTLVKRLGYYIIHRVGTSYPAILLGLLCISLLLRWVR